MLIVQDVRLPVQPAIPVVHSPSAGATATHTGKPEEDPRLKWGARAQHVRAGDYTALDRALIRAVTGEDVDALREAELSAFATQILLDRRKNRLTPGREVDVDYLTRTSRRLSGLGERNPFSGAQLRRAMQFVQGREGGRVDIVL